MAQLETAGNRYRYILKDMLDDAVNRFDRTAILKSPSTSPASPENTGHFHLAQHAVDPSVDRLPLSSSRRNGVFETRHIWSTHKMGRVRGFAANPAVSRSRMDYMGITGNEFNVTNKARQADS